MRGGAGARCRPAGLGPPQTTYPPRFCWRPGGASARVLGTMQTVEKESIIVRMPALCPPCHSDQVVQRGKTTVQI